MGVKYNAAYCASKAAIGAITRCLAVEWAKQGIRVVDVAPGFTLTDLNRRHLEDPKFRGFLERAIPRGRPGEHWEVARFDAALVPAEIPFPTQGTHHLHGGRANAKQAT